MNLKHPDLLKTAPNTRGGHRFPGPGKRLGRSFVSDKKVPLTIPMWKNRKQDTWVFYNEKTKTRFQHRPKFMKGLCKKAVINPHFGFHILRHLMASLLADDPNISTKTIQNILGHSNIKTTEIYIHSIEGSIEDAMDSISGKFAQKIQNRNQELQPKIKKANSQKL